MNLTVSASPYIKGNTSTRRIMRDAALAALPASGTRHRAFWPAGTSGDPFLRGGCPGRRIFKGRNDLAGHTFRRRNLCRIRMDLSFGVRAVFPSGPAGKLAAAKETRKIPEKPKDSVR